MQLDWGWGKRETEERERQFPIKLDCRKIFLSVALDHFKEPTEKKI